MKTYRPGSVDSEELRREIQSILAASLRADPFSELLYLHAEPDKVRAGMVVLADGTDWDPGSGVGPYRRSEDNTTWVFIGSTGGAGTGDVVGPASATNNNVALFNGATGKLIKDSGVQMNAAGVGLGSVTNDAQTKASIVPNTVPAAGNLLVGNAGGTAYASVAATGDVTVASTGAHTVANNAVTYAKMQDVSATSRVLGRKTAGAGDPEELTAAEVLAFIGATQGQILYRDGSGWTVLAPGTAGQVLKTGGAGANPSWTGNGEMLANVTLGSAGTSLASGTISAKQFLEIHIWIEGYAGSDTASLQFNGSGGTAYRYHWTHIASGATTLTAGLRATSTDRIKVASVNTTSPRRVVAYIGNDSSVTEKLVQFASVTGTGSAATHATTDMGNGAWISGAATQITSVSLISTSNLLAGTQMTIFGWN